MKSLTTVLIFFFVFNLSFSQVTDVVEQFALDASVSESSGLIYYNGKIITHNDSGNPNELYEMNPSSPTITRIVTVTGATNVDWEDITQDGDYIYIGDFGNNVSGNRTDLKIYKISKADYLNTTSVTAETIAFSYSDQTDFTPTSANNTEWDAEALVSYDASNLILFTKNWVNGITKAYLVPKTPGSFSLSPLSTTLNSAGLITGGTFNPLSGKLYLAGYTPPVLPTPLQPFVWVSENFSGNDIFSGTNTQTPLPSSFGFEQIEGITYTDENSYLITSEAVSSIISDYAKLISFSTNDMALSSDALNKENEIVLYPNPVSNILYIKSRDANSIEIYDTKLTKLYSGFNRNIDMGNFSKGIYIVKINLTNDSYMIKKVIKK
jgi:hypothetical protein